MSEAETTVAIVNVRPTDVAVVRMATRINGAQAEAIKARIVKTLGIRKVIVLDSGIRIDFVRRPTSSLQRRAREMRRRS